MGQREILNLLANNPNDTFTCRELASKIGISPTATSTNLITLRNMRMVNVFPSKTKTPNLTYEYGFLRR